MEIKEIFSTANPLLKTIRLLHDRSGRKKTGLFLLEGLRLIEDALNNELDVLDIVVSQTYLKNGRLDFPNIDQVEFSVVDDVMFNQLSTTTTPQGILAVAKMQTSELSEILYQERILLVVADMVQDPGNLGTIMRTALAFGATGAVLTKGTTDVFSPKVVRAAMGALFAMPVVTDIVFQDLIAELKARSVEIIALDQNAPESIWQIDIPEKVALLLGNEGNGLSDEYMKLTDRTVAIPISARSESLNVATAAGVALAYISSKRGVN
ncbi:MAG: RNA methyltransferase [Leptolyngbya sp.]|nr:RNA methyltransferase [Candidatus Melainabacteria bacterium]